MFHMIPDAVNMPALQRMLIGQPDSPEMVSVFSTSVGVDIIFQNKTTAYLLMIGKP